MQTPDVLIIGAGIIGCSLARELARVRSKVTVLDRGAVGCGASSAAAGLLMPRFGTAPAGPLAELCQQSALLYEDWVDELRHEGAADVGFRRPGTLSVCLDAAEADDFQRVLSDLILPGQRAYWLSAGELRHREPALCERVLGAAYFPDDAAVEPAKLTQQVARVAVGAGVQLREHEPVIKVDCRGPRITAVHTLTGSYHPGTVVLTAGAWSGPLADTLGIQLPTRPVKGQLLMADCRVPPVHTPMHTGDVLLVPWPDGRLLVGVTVEEAGFDEAVRLDGLRRILEQAVALVPSLGHLPLQRAWAGLRPATPDGWPYMGTIPPYDNLWVSAGHFRKGILLAPLSARMMAASILGNRPIEELEPFKPTRRIVA